MALLEKSWLGHLACTANAVSVMHMPLVGLPTVYTSLSLHTLVSNYAEPRLVGILLCFCLIRVCGQIQVWREHLYRLYDCRFDEFFAACKDCHFDFLATHLYTCNVEALRWYLSECKRYRLPIWLTEFSCPNGVHGPASQQLAFIADAIRLLDQDAAVERYAWFAPRTAGDWLGPTASLLQADKPDLTQLGKLYTSEQGQTPVAATADKMQSWTSMCSECLSNQQPLDLPEASRQLCIDCGFNHS